MSPVQSVTYVPGRPPKRRQRFKTEGIVPARQTNPGVPLCPRTVFEESGVFPASETPPPGVPPGTGRLYIIGRLATVEETVTGTTPLSRLIKQRLPSPPAALPQPLEKGEHLVPLGVGQEHQ